MRLDRFKAARIEVAWMCLDWATRMIPCWGKIFEIRFLLIVFFLFFFFLFFPRLSAFRLCRRHVKFFAGSGFYREASRAWNSSRFASSDLVISQGLQQRLDRKKKGKNNNGN